MLIRLMAEHLSSRKVLLTLLNGKKMEQDVFSTLVQQEMIEEKEKPLSEETIARRLGGVQSMCKQILARMGIVDKNTKKQV